MLLLKYCLSVPKFSRSSVCPSFSTFICLTDGMFFCLYLCQSVCLPTRQYFYISVCSYASQSVYQSVRWSTHLSVCSSTPTPCLSECLIVKYVHLSVSSIGMSFSLYYSLSAYVLVYPSVHPSVFK